MFKKVKDLKFQGSVQMKRDGYWKKRLIYHFEMNKINITVSAVAIHI